MTGCRGLATLPRYTLLGFSTPGQNTTLSSTASCLTAATTLWLRPQRESAAGTMLRRNILLFHLYQGNGLLRKQIFVSPLSHHRHNLQAGVQPDRQRWARNIPAEHVSSRAYRLSMISSMLVVRKPARSRLSARTTSGLGVNVLPDHKNGIGENPRCGR